MPEVHQSSTSTFTPYYTILEHFLVATDCNITGIKYRSLTRLSLN